MSTRQEKVGELLKVEISQMLQRELKDPRIGFVTITDVEVSPDLRHARVFVSIMGEEEERQASMKALKSASGFIRSELGKRLRMRVTPDVEFRIDSSIEQGARIFELLEQIKRNESQSQED
ncbi:MAG TPA: 30S ribosome-binding factor RbfA [Armatimonadota bacterium]|mgnify:CR=1 FL=1|nr:30S ribosome-binding factor RbfA [Armatimonadota bacterium]HOM71269.1 30S ribosome-binding factor RbfA [Armatimonadota bacterium]HOP80132.1 30S ribosome-binding factor RbfA [Armatimonadota bacterium]HPP75282.1 30S ribosome-binding factor RbfA [Armatimonadota bacterium]